jgi:hypothetical protein
MKPKKEKRQLFKAMYPAKTSRHNFIFKLSNSLSAYYHQLIKRIYGEMLMIKFPYAETLFRQSSSNKK